MLRVSLWQPLPQVSAKRAVRCCGDDVLRVTNTSVFLRPYRESRDVLRLGWSILDRVRNLSLTTYGTRSPEYV